MVLYGLSFIDGVVNVLPYFFLKFLGSFISIIFFCYKFLFLI